MFAVLQRYFAFGATAQNLLFDNAGINVIHNHPPRDRPSGHDLKEAKTLPPGQSLCPKTLPSGQKRESKPHPRDIKLQNFTNVSVNSDTI